MALLDDFKKLKREGRFAEINTLLPYAALVGFDCIERDGAVLSVLRARESNIGNTLIRAVHGGVVSALLEHAGAMQVIYEADPLDAMPKVVNLTVDYLRPCLADEDTFARGFVVKHGRRVANLRVEAWQSDPSKPVAVGLVHFLMGGEGGAL
jgi:uncharacterized protein (TIGR00369 family)